MKKILTALAGIALVIFGSIQMTDIAQATTTSPFWVAVGCGPSDTMAYSEDGLTWTGLGKPVFSSCGGPGPTVAFNGERWVAVGDGANNIAYSDDGITWTGLGTSVLTGYGNAVAWNGSRWVAVGDGVDSIVYSDDGINWTGVTGKSIFSGDGFSIAWNGSMWLAGGQGTNTLASSPDGINWTPLGFPVFTGYTFGVAWNGSMWVAVGDGGPNTIGYSTTADASVWTGVGATALSDYGDSVAWNGNRWVAGGHGTNALAYSDDGINWTGITGNTVLHEGYSVAWNGTRWVAVGTDGIAASDDGLSWTLVDGSLLSTPTGVASNPRPNLYPAYPNVQTVTVNISGAGSGTVTSDVGGISVAYPASTTDSGSVTSGSNITITASAASSDQVANMDADCHAAGGTLTKTGSAIATCTIAGVATTTTIGVSFVIPTIVGAGGTMPSSGGSSGGGSSFTPPPAVVIPPTGNTGSGQASTTQSTSVQPPRTLPKSKYLFLRNLRLGMVGEDIKEFQKYLNENGFVVAASGAGSPGNETTKFGMLTYAAVIKFQEFYVNEILIPAGVPSGKGTGFIGPFTRAQINGS